MASVLDRAEREALLQRFGKLTADTRPKWGQFTASRMLAHVMDPMLAAMGDKQVADRPGPFRNPVLRYLIIYLLPWPKGAPTSPEFLTGAEPDVPKGVKKLRNVVERFAAQVAAGREMAPHPSFGKLSAQDWGALQHRHLEHHLKQFGL